VHEHRFHTSRSARYFTLGEAGPDTTDLWIACHGYGQLARDFLEGFEPISALERVIAAPEALSRFYAGSPDARQPGARVGASWMTREDRLAEIEDQVAYLDGVAAELSARTAEGTRLRVLGFSQGVATVCRWIGLGRSRPVEIILWAGEIPADLPDPLLGERLGSARVRLVSGTRDRLLPDALVAHHETRLRAAGIDPIVHRFDGGHRLDRAILQDIAARS
jgi:predicted esterase